MLIDKTEDWNTANNYPLPWRSQRWNISKVISDVYRYDAAFRYPYPITSYSYWIQFTDPGVAPPLDTSTDCAETVSRLTRYVQEDSGIPYSVNITALPGRLHADLINN